MKTLHLPALVAFLFGMTLLVVVYATGLVARYPELGMAISGLSNLMQALLPSIIGAQLASGKDPQ